MAKPRAADIADMKLSFLYPFNQRIIKVKMKNMIAYSARQMNSRSRALLVPAWLLIRLNNFMLIDSNI
jgi:hypothetical protein